MIMFKIWLVTQANEHPSRFMSPNLILARQLLYAMRKVPLQKYGGHDLISRI